MRMISNFRRKDSISLTLSKHLIKRKNKKINKMLVKDRMRLMLKVNKVV